MSSLIRTYTKYWARRREVKAELNAELYERLRPEAEALAHEIQKERNFLTMEQIALKLGRKNKSFLYDILGYLTPREGDATPVQDEPDTYTVTAVDNNYVVVFLNGDEYTLTRNHFGDIETPDEWANHSKERRAIYREILGSL